LQWRGGHVWCTKHRRWWKRCSCRGDFLLKLTVTPELIADCQAKFNAFQAAVLARLATV
jgi:hypothetical protein